MVKQILICPKCNIFTMKDVCPKCDTKTISVIPAKYSPEDKYAKYRRKAKFNLRLL